MSKKYCHHYQHGLKCKKVRLIVLVEEFYIPHWKRQNNNEKQSNKRNQDVLIAITRKQLFKNNTNVLSIKWMEY